MSQDVTLPALGESVTEGTVTRWLKNVGDTVEIDEPLVEVSTDKVDTEVPSPVAGTLQEIVVNEDETAEVGAVLARIGDGAAAQSTGSDAGDKQQTEQSSEPAGAQQSDSGEPTQPSNEPASATGSAEGEEVTLPSLGESVTEGTVTRWLKQVGDTVNVDEALVEVSTDKVDTEVPSPVAGTLLEIRVNEDETAQVGSVLAIVGDGSAASKPREDSSPEAAASQPKPETDVTTDAAASEDGARTVSTPDPVAASTGKQADQSAPAGSGSTPPASSGPTPPKRPRSKSDPRYITPIVRKLANAKGVDLTQISGTGVGGRIRKEDVLAAAEQSAAKSAPAAATAKPASEYEVSPLRGTSEKMSRLRKVISSRAVESMQQTAQLTTMVEVDVTRVAKFRQARKAEFLEKTGSKLSFLPFFAVAAVEALQTYPVINATVKDDEIHYPDHENISIAVDTERGLLTPVVKNAGGMSLAELAKSIDDLASRTRDNKLTPDELAGGTFTLTNTGSRGALFDTPLVFLPQLAILGTGAVVKKPAVVMTEDGNEAIAIRSMVHLALSYDHRIIDGADAARFLTQIKKRLEEGNFEANLGY